MHSPKVVIIGAGVSGLTLGWKLAEAGMNVRIFESAPSAGGLAGTFRQDGYSLDIGPHSFFTEDSEVREMVLSLFGPQESLEAKSRRVKLHFQGRWLDYPFTAVSVLSQMGLPFSTAVLLDLLKAKISPKPLPSGRQEDLSVEDWVPACFGRHLYESFFKPYTEQFWQIPCAELSARAIPTHTQLSFANALQSILRKTRTKGASSQIDREKLPTYYPKKGYGEISEKIAERFSSAGGEIHFSCRVESLNRHSDGTSRVVYLKGSERHEAEADHVISTLPISIFAGMIRPSLPPEVLSSAEKLEFRPFLMLGMALRRQNVLSADYIYTLGRPYNRITEFNKFSPALSPAGENILAVEIPCRYGSEIWNACKEDLFEQCLPGLEKDISLKREEVSRLFLVKAAHAYPVYRKGYETHLRRVLKVVEDIPGFSTLGRGGEFHYMDADQCVRRALDLSKRLVRDYLGVKA